MNNLILTLIISGLINLVGTNTFAAQNKATPKRDIETQESRDLNDKKTLEEKIKKESDKAKKKVLEEQLAVINKRLDARKNKTTDPLKEIQKQSKSAKSKTTKKQKKSRQKAAPLPATTASTGSVTTKNTDASTKNEED